MKFLFKILLTSLILLCAGNDIFSQTKPEDIAKKEFERRGLGDEEVRKRLEEKGFDIDNIDINNPAEVFKLEKSLKEVIDELEQEKLNNATPKKTNAPATTPKTITEDEAKILAKEGENISDAIDDGASLEEAVSEELIDSQEDNKEAAKVYGQEVFRSQSIKLYRQSEDVKPPETYILGVGDVVAVSIWGASEEDLIFEINNDGYIKPDGIPRIYLKGLQFDQVRSLLFDRFSSYYNFKRNQFEISLNFSRTINVNITGEVYNYGTFNIPAINTIFNALVAAGGPNDIGSVRKIKHIRLGKSENIIDIYRYLKDPTYAANMYLEENDILHVPVADKIINITGAVIRPHKYELLESENLVEILKLCGGLKVNASLKNIQITRYENDIQKIIDVNLNEIIRTNKDFDLKNGDNIVVKVIPEAFKNSVQISGAVDIPGTYAIDKNSNISDLLAKINLSDDAQTSLAYLKRQNKDTKNYQYKPIKLSSILKNKSSDQNIQLQNNDELMIYTVGRYVDAEKFTVAGEVREPGVFPYDYSNSLKVSDAIVLCGGVKKYATEFAYIQRINPETPFKYDYIRVDLIAISNNDNSASNLEILPGDKLIFYSQKDYTTKKMVKVSGYINNPGEFEYGESLIMQDIINMSGGLKESSTDFAYVERKDPNKPKETQYLKVVLSEEGFDFKIFPEDHIVFYDKKDFVDKKVFTIVGSVRKGGDYIYGPNTSLADLITMAGGLSFGAYRKKVDIYRLDLNDDQKTTTLAATLELDKDNKPIGGEFILQPFDRVVVRQAPEFELIRTVYLKGEVKFPGTYALVSDNESITSVIERAGGFTNEAFINGTYVKRKGKGIVTFATDKALRNKNSAQNIIMHNNDEIVVPKMNNLVTIIGAHNANSVYHPNFDLTAFSDEENEGITTEIKEKTTINVPFDKRKNAKYYVEKYAGGIHEVGDKSKMYVHYANGRVKSVEKSFLFFWKYPKIEAGCTIYIPTAPPKEKFGEEQKTDWNSILTNAVGQATAVLTLILLVQRID